MCSHSWRRTMRQAIARLTSMPIRNDHPGKLCIQRSKWTVIRDVIRRTCWTHVKHQGTHTRDRQVQMACRRYRPLEPGSLRPHPSRILHTPERFSYDRLSTRLSCTDYPWRDRTHQRHLRQMMTHFMVCNVPLICPYRSPSTLLMPTALYRIGRRYHLRRQGAPKDGHIDEDPPAPPLIPHQAMRCSRPG